MMKTSFPGGSVSDLIQRLQQAATEAIENERQGLSYDPARLRCVTVELEVSLSGAVVVGNVYVQRRGKVRRERGTAA
jgi:hypothetical protein